MISVRVPIYVCPACDAGYPISDLRWRCDCGSHLNISDPPPLDPGRIRPHPGLWRYRELLALPPGTEPVSLGEGLTPLIDTVWSGVPVHLKLDYMTPTGSFKDRGAAVLIAALRQLGVLSVHEDSSGNGGAAMAAYTARAGLRCTIYAPAHASVSKLVQITAYGAELKLIAGSRTEVRQAAEAPDQDSFYAGHNWHPLFIEGVKTYGLELWEQLGRRSPSAVFMPLGGGSSLLGAYAAFRSLKAAGLVNRMPALFPVQPTACAPVFQAFRSGLDRAMPVEPGNSLAEGALIGAPLRSREILAAVRETGGQVVAVTEEELIDAMGRLAHSGFYVEPTAALAAAGLAQLLRAGLTDCLEGAVLQLTGTGLKANDAWNRLF